MEVQPQPASEEVIYESGHTALGHRLGVALGAGFAVFASLSFFRGGWDAWATARLYLVPALLTSVVLVVAALRSRTVWRVTLDREAKVLRIERDPDVTERWPFTELASAEAVPVSGGWSRDPADRLRLRMRDGRELTLALPDDALTTGIASDIRGALAGEPQVGQEQASKGG